MKFRLLWGLALVGMLSVSSAFAATVCQSLGLTDLNGAQSLNLGTLSANANNCISIGDKAFFNFTFTPDGAHPGVVTANGISVSTIGTGTPLDLWGIQFGSNLGSVNNLAGSNTLALDYNLTYSVQATGGFLVSDIGQFFNGSAITANQNLNPNSAITITETALDHGFSGSQAISTVSLNPDDLKDPPAEAGDHLLLSVQPGNIPTPVLRADITKDIRIDAGAGDKVTLSLIQQRFSQVPEPRTVAMLLGGLFAVFVWRKKRATATV